MSTAADVEYLNPVYVLEEEPKAIRARSRDGHRIAAAVNVGAGWLVFTYGTDSPCGGLMTESKVVAKEWVEYLGALHTKGQA